MEPEPPELEEHLTETSSAAAVGEAGSGVEPEPSKLEKHLFETSSKVGEAAGIVCSRSFDIHL